MTQKTTFIWISSSLLTNSTLGYVHVKFISELGNYPLDFGKVKKSKFWFVLSGLKHSLIGHFDIDLTI